MKKRLFSLFLISAMVLGSLTACGGGKKEETKAAESTATETTAASDSQGGEATGDKILRVASEDPQVPLDMHLNTYSLIMKVTDNVVESLLYTNMSGELEPTLLAEMPTLSEDKLTYSFTLKEGVKFHNGETLTSNDVKYSLERVVKSASMASLMEKVEGYEALNNGEADELSGIVVIDDTHFEIHMAEIYTPFLSVLSTPYCGIYPAAACEEAGDDWGMTVLYGTGPYKLVSYQTGVGVELAKFEDYHEGAPKLDGVKYTFINDPNTGVLEYQKGNIDVVYMDAALYPTYANGELADELYSFQPVGGYYVTFNINDIPEKEVREAFNYAIDRESLCSSVLFGTAAPSSNLIGEGLIGYNESAETFTYDTAKAKELLAKAGYADGYDLRVTVNTKYSTSLTIATALQAQAKEAGFNIEIEQVDSAAWTDMKKNGGVTCGIGNWYVDYNDPDSMLYPVSDSRTDLNSSFWHNEEFKECMEKGVQTDDTAERQALYERADQILCHEDFAIAPLYYETKFYLKKPNVTGFEVGPTFRTMFIDTDIEQ